MISLSKHTSKSIGLSSCKVKSSGVVVFSRINLSYLPRQSPLTAFDPSCLQHTPWEDKRKSMYDVAIKVKQAGAAGWGGGGGKGGLRWREWAGVWIFIKNLLLNSLLTGESFQSDGQNFDPSQASNCGQIPHSPGQSDGQTSRVCLGGGREDAEFELIGILHKLSTSPTKHSTCSK